MKEWKEAWNNPTESLVGFIASTKSNRASLKIATSLCIYISTSIHVDYENKAEDRERERKIYLLV